MEGYSFCTSAKIVSDINEKNACVLLYFLNVSVAKDTKQY
jgi:hypothetical protein